MATYDITFNAVSIPTNSGGASIVVEEDSDSDGTVENSDTVSLSDATMSYTTADVFAGSGQVRIDLDFGPPSDETVTASVTGPIDVVPNTTTLSGTVTLSGSGVQDATIHVINDTDDSIETTTTTDSNGDYSVSVPSGNTYHVTVRYEDSNGNKYNDESKPFIAT